MKEEDNGEKQNDKNKDGVVKSTFKKTKSGASKDKDSVKSDTRKNVSSTVDSVYKGLNNGDHIKKG